MFSLSALPTLPSLASLRLLYRRFHTAPRHIQVYVIATFIGFLIILKTLYSFDFDLPLSHTRITPYEAGHPAQNQTLGFGKVFYISLPYRTDRQDSMELLATKSNMTVTYQPAVIGSTMNHKAKLSDGGFLRDEQWGCWRSHADAWRRVIKENLDTALILEDDADWDVNVHDAFHELSRQMRKGKLRHTQMTDRERKIAPYGLDWDVLYVGTCFDIPHEPRPKHVTYNDPTAPVRANLTQTFINELENWGARITDQTHKRVLAPSWYPICTIGYAVTQIGARRLLYNVGGVKAIGSAVDLAMNSQVQMGFIRGYTLVPPLITPWKTGGVQDSDIDDMEVKAKELKEGEKLEVGSRNLLRSARMSLNETYGNVMDI